MRLNKSHWTADSDKVYLSVPVSKVDTERRLVSGFATLDNIDTSDDVVTVEASRSAFSRFRGNIREMHEPIAAGRLVDFVEDSFYDTRTEKFYNGVYVTAYVSLGAESTWQKVLDGTLSGFSIGGNITEQTTEYVPEENKSIRFIKDYDLIELSLVDNPANQLANVFSIVKSQEGSFVKGMVSETHVTNVFWCAGDKIAKNSTNENEDCLACGIAMEQIGWFEKGGDEAEKTASTVSNFLRKGEAIVETDIAHGEGGVDMTDKIEKDADDVITSEDVASEEAVEEVVEEKSSEEDVVASDEAVEEATDEPDIEKMFDDLKVSVKDSIEKTVESVEKKVADVTKAFDEKASEFEKSLGELSERLEAIRTEREDVAKRLDALEKASAVKKSGEVESAEPVKKSQKGLWGGTFFGSE